MKAENEISEFVRLADISTIYKGKGKKCELINDRGIFVVTILRSILMRLIYLDKNIRNHIWIVNDYNKCPE